MAARSPCVVAHNYLEDNEVKPISEHLSSGSVSFYVPVRTIRALFEGKVNNLTLEKIFLCPCDGCEQDGGSVDERETHFNRLRVQELQSDYALIYALLIYVSRPGLIRKFQKHERKLQGTDYLNEGSFEVFKRENIHRLNVLQRKVLDHQYSFLVRILKPHSDITAISRRELLPIKEDLEPKGEGSFAEVRCFEFQDDEYRCRKFGEHITRFARKIFKQGMVKSAAQEWNTLQDLSKRENHAHLMVALGAYWHGNQFFILQEEADHSLHDYLKGNGAEYEPAELWKQMGGVADGLATLHRIYKGTKIAYHKDLKPANILIVKKIFKIADFGLLEFKPVALPGDTGSTGVPNTHNTGYYAPPRQDRYTRDSDIWSLGCIISELSTCDIQGRGEFEGYRKARIAGGGTPRFFQGKTVQDAVLNRHTSLYTLLQSESRINEDTAAAYFRQKFYTKDFFLLLNRMFRSPERSSTQLSTPNEAHVPDADIIARTIEALRRAAAPPSASDDQIQNPSFEQSLSDPEALNSSMMTCLTDFKEILNRSNHTQLPSTTLADLKQFIVNLQARQHAGRRQQGLKRLEPFLTRLEEFGNLIVDLPCSTELMSLIWGSARFLLEATDCRNDAFREILDVYNQIGRNQPSLSMYQELFAMEPDLSRTLASMYEDIIIVNKLLVIYFQQRFWSKLFTTTWRRHRSKFSNVLDRMASRFDLVRDCASVAQFDSAQNVFILQDQQYLAEMEDQDLARKQAVYASLKPTDMETEQDYLMGLRGAHPESCQWLLKDNAFQDWFDPERSSTTLPRLLWLNGKPGAGKTVLVSFIVEKLRKLRPLCTVLFFYFKQKDTERDNFLAMARTFLMQILQQNPHTLDYFYSKCCSSGSFLTSRAMIEELLQFAVVNCDSTYVLLDGLDECSSRKERGEIVSWFREIAENLDPDEYDRLRCMFISQRDSARKDYHDLQIITADAGNNKEDIESFCRMQSRRLVDKLHISEQQALEIAASVSASAEGMFLFAHLFWINLCGQSSIDSLEHEIRSFPTDDDKLGRIYDRIMQTILDKDVRAERDEALMILRWLVCAKRSLKMHEVQTMKSINLHKGTVEFERRRFRVHLKELCESLVEVREDGTIELVHMTARSYLAKSDHVDVVAEELRLATLCIDYLNLPSFKQPISKQAVLAGQYGFMEYAIIYWLRHMEAGLTHSLSGQDQLYQDLTKSLESFIARHWNEPLADGTMIPQRTQKLLECLKNCHNFPKIQVAIVLTDKELKRFGDTQPEKSASDFLGIVSAVRRCLEATSCEDPDEDLAHDLKLKYGSYLYKCSRFSCKYFTEGFSTSDEREIHLEPHERPARCTDEHCRGFKIGFATTAQLERHLKETHPDSIERHQNFPTDEEVDESARLENILDAESDVESDAASDVASDVEPDNPSGPKHPKLTESATAEAARLAQGSVRLHGRTNKRTKVSATWPCEHCGKTFEKKSNWQSHLVTHTSGAGERYTCDQCRKTCARWTDYVRHMDLHDPQHAVTCGGLSIDGRLWGCGKSFARADILRTHHKSRRGMQCIAERDDEGHAGTL